MRNGNNNGPMQKKMLIVKQQREERVIILMALIPTNCRFGRWEKTSSTQCHCAIILIEWRCCSEIDYNLMIDEIIIYSDSDIIYAVQCCQRYDNNTLNPF